VTEGKREGTRVIKPTVVVAIVLFGASNLTLAQYDVRDAEVIDLLSPQDGEVGAKRRCTVEVDKTNIPCNDAWYVQFKDGSRAIQFNQAIQESPIVSLFASEIAPDKLSVESVFLRLGGRSMPELEREAVGECVLNKQEIRCQARTTDGRHIAGHIFPR
jgi:hypothetical protein